MSKTAKINFEKIGLPKAGTLVFLVNEKGELTETGKTLDSDNGGFIKKAIKVADFKGKKSNILDIITPSDLPFDRVLLLGTGSPKSLSMIDWRHLGGSLVGSLASKKIKAATLCLEIAVEEEETSLIACNVAHGAVLRQYTFDKYKSRKGASEKPAPFIIEGLTIQSAAATKAKKRYSTDFTALQEGVFTARDLVNEPANILGPDEYAKRIKAMSKLGLDIEILDEKEMKKLNMNALLGVGQGSRQGSYLAIMKWMGASKTKDQPVAIIGKGVCFDTGGISIKGAGGMEDMKGDMGGSAAVVGLMQTLAQRKAKVNVIGVVGLVENMPDGLAQRPGDIVTSMSGQTIEVINTDAEGRLVLADALWYTQEKYKPSHMVNLATLTGAIIVALGKEYAGLFSNDDELADALTKAGKRTGEGVWRMPIGPAYDKLINSKFADMKNTGGRWGGAITAAQFLKRHVNETAWAHLDVAGTAMASEKSPINQSWGSGYGVDLLNDWIRENYEN